MSQGSGDATVRDALRALSNAAYYDDATFRWTCAAKCGAHVEKTACVVPPGFVPIGWHTFDGKAYCSLRCVALVVKILGGTP